MAGIDNKTTIADAKKEFSQLSKSLKINWLTNIKSMNVAEMLPHMIKELGVSERVYPTWVANNKKNKDLLFKELSVKSTMIFMFKDLLELLTRYGKATIQMHRLVQLVEYALMTTTIQRKIACPKSEFFTDYLEAKGINEKTLKKSYEHIKYSWEEYDWEEAVYELETATKKPGTLWMFYLGTFYNVDFFLYKEAVDFERATN